MRGGLFLLALLTLLPAGRPASGQAGGVLFRYLPGAPELSSAVSAEDVEAGPFLDPRELTARGPSGWGMSAPSTAEYEAPGSVLRSTSSEDRDQPLGPNITVEAWLHSQEDGQTTTLVTNQVGTSDGFTLGLDQHRPYLAFTRGTQTYRVSAPDVAPAHASVWVAATISYFNQVLTLKLFVNGHAVSSGTFPEDIASPYRIAAPFMVGTSAAGAADAPGLTGTFTGQLFGAVVKGYVVDERYLASSIPLDGGPYFGLPDYHDYSLSAFHIPMDQRIQAEPVQIKHRFFLPYANDEFVPQGVATHIEEAAGGSTPLVYVAYYHITRAGVTETQHSIVTEIDATTGHVRRTFRLMGELGYSHVGGIAYTHGAIYVSSVGVLERYPIPEWAGPEGPKYIDLEADPNGTVSVQAKASYVSAHRDTLWVGDWRTSSDVAPFLYAHAVDANGRPESAASRIFALPRNIQGVDLFEFRGDTYVVLSRNKSSSAAELLRYRIEDLQRHVVASADSSITLPHGIEDLSFFPDGTLWTNSESGTDYYQRRSNPWTSFYPFVYSVDAEVVFGAPVTSLGRTDPDQPTPRLTLDSYPNPFRTAATVRLTTSEVRDVQVYVVDMLGRRVQTLTEGRLSPGHHQFEVDGHALPAGQFFTVVDDGDQRTVKAMTRTK